MESPINWNELNGLDSLRWHEQNSYRLSSSGESISESSQLRLKFLHLEMSDTIGLSEGNALYRCGLALITVILFGCNPQSEQQPPGHTGLSSVQVEAYGVTQEGRTVNEFTLTNRQGAVARFINYGGILTELWMPDRDGSLADVVLGFDNLAQFEAENHYFGSITGRVANRIERGRFSLDGQTYQLAINNAPNHLHGGIKAFDRVVWQGEQVHRQNGPAVRFSYLSPNGDEGYPGNLTVSVTYQLTHDNALRIEYEATTDQATPVNLTNHTYFNLAGHTSGPIYSQTLRLHSATYTEFDPVQIPTGRVLSVAGSPLDFTKATPIGSRMDQVGAGYDQNFVIDAADGSLLPAAEALDPSSGRFMEVLTTQPGVQLYTGNHFEQVIGKESAVYGQHQGFCLETQNFPNAINHDDFPTSVLRPGAIYSHTTEYRFSTR